MIIRRCIYSLLLWSMMHLLFADSPMPPTTAQAPNGSVLLIWTQITDHEKSKLKIKALKGVARFVVQGYNSSNSYCNKFKLAYVPAGGDHIVYNLAVNSRTNPDVLNFPVTVCEVSLDAGWTSLKLVVRDNSAWTGISYFNSSGKLVTSNSVNFPSLYDVGRKNNGELRLVTTADTGCRNNSDTRSKNYQLCNSEQWPLQAIIEDMLTKNPDLAIHSGDYRYRFQHLKNATDKWSYWYQDFFYPATSLLFSSDNATVWAFNRGNHEQCSGDTNAGNGWYYFLDSHTTDKAMSCATEPPDPKHHWYFDVAVTTISNGVKSSKAPHRFIFLDTSTKNGSKKTFKTMNKWADKAQDTAWWAMHKPIWGITTDGGLNTRTDGLQNNLHDAMDKQGKQQIDCNPAANDNGFLKGVWSYDQLSCHLRTVLSGHSHIMAISRFYKNIGDTAGIWMRPQQVVDGHGGINLDPALAATPCTMNIDTLNATMTWGDYWGYLFWVRSDDIAISGDQSGWDMQKIVIRGNKELNTKNPAACELADSSK